MISKKSIVAVSIIALAGFLFFNFTAPDAKAATVEELQAQIQSMQRLIVQLQAQLAKFQGGETPAPWCHTFNVNLRIGDSGDGNSLSGTGLEVHSLITALSEEGLLNYDQVVQPGSAGTSLKATYFSETVASAVVAFQEKYKSEVLSPWGLAHGTGYVGATTRAKLNKLYGCVSTCSSEGTFCGGIAGTQCCFGLTCQYSGDYPDAGGKCVKQTATPSITVLSPNGGERWEIGKTYDITWKANGLDKIDIFLWNDAQHSYGWPPDDVFVIASNLPANQQTYTWTIPKDIRYIDQNKLRILILKSGTYDVYDSSDNYFSIVSAATVSCTDSDTEKAGIGKNYYKKGTVQVGGSSFEDSCKYNSLTGKTDGLSEYFCDSTTYGKWNHITVKCSGGCVNGACLGTAISPICSDPDGSDIYTKGLANDEYGTGQGDCCVADSWASICVSESNYVKEGLCKSGTAVGQWTFTNQTYKCPNGCKDGACISTTPSITAPIITSLSSNSGAANDTIIIYGKNLINTDPSGNTNPSGITVEFLRNGVQTGTISGPIYTQPDGLSLKFQLSGIFVANTQVGLYQIRVANAKGKSNTVDFTILGSTTPYINIFGSSGNQTNSSDLTVNLGNTFTISGVPQNLQGLSYWFGSGYPPAGYYNRAYFFDQAFSNNNSCGNNEASVGGPWTMTCTAKVAGSSSFYIQIYANGQIYKSNVVSVTIPSSVQSSITVLSPNGGEQWEIGEYKEIKYYPSGVPKAKIFLKDDIRQTTCQLNEEEILAIGSNSDYSFGFTVGLGKCSVLPGDKFKIEIYYENDQKDEPAVYDYSDNYFSIIVATESEHSIWNYPGTQCTGYGDVNRDPYTFGYVGFNDGGVMRTVSDYCDIVNGSSVVEQVMCSGDKFYGWGYSSCPNGCQDGACIQGATPSVTVLSPNGGEQWETGETHFIKWVSTGYDSGVSVQIGLRDGRYDPNLANGEITIANTTNTGSFNWTIPSTIEAGSFFKIIVYVDGGGQEGKYDLSDNNFQITKAITKETLTLRPNGPGSECNIPNQSGCSACPNHYTCVYEVVGDGNTYVYHHGNTSTWKRDLYSLSDSVNLGIINKVTVYRWVRCNNSTSMASIRTYGTVYDGQTACSGAAATINNSPFGGQVFPSEWTTNPYTGKQWTWEDINNLEVGVSLFDGDAFNTPDWADLTQVYVEVDYTPELGLEDAKDQLASISEAVSGLLEKINQMFNQ